MREKELEVLTNKEYLYVGAWFIAALLMFISLIFFAGVFVGKLFY